MTDDVAQYPKIDLIAVVQRKDRDSTITAVVQICPDRKPVRLGPFPWFGSIVPLGRALFDLLPDAFDDEADAQRYITLLHGRNLMRRQDSNGNPYPTRGYAS